MAVEIEVVPERVYYVSTYLGDVTVEVTTMSALDNKLRGDRCRQTTGCYHSNSCLGTPAQSNFTNYLGILPVLTELAGARKQAKPHEALGIKQSRG